MILDCILYNGEQSLLDIRLNETKLFNQDVLTVIICSSQTHTGWNKPTYEEHLQEFKNFNILACSVDKLEGRTPMEREIYQRNKIKDVLLAMPLKGDDIIIISDVDEIPRARQVNKFLPAMKFAALIQHKFNYKLNLLEGYEIWNRARIMTWDYLKRKQPDDVRNSGYDFAIQDAGFHFSWVCDPLRKLESYSHQEHNTQQNFERIERMENFWNGVELKRVDIDLSFPEYLFKNQEKFKDLCTTNLK